MGYPLGVNETTENAPWNVIEIEREVEITLKCVVSTTISSKKSKEEENIIIEQLVKDRVQHINVIHGFDDIEVNKIEIL